MKQFRIKQYSHNSLYCIQQRTGLFSWSNLFLIGDKYEAVGKYLTVKNNHKQYPDYPIIGLSTNDAIVFIPTIAYHKKSLLFAWLNVAIGINF